jgi:hypothetical protein
MTDDILNQLMADGVALRIIAHYCAAAAARAMPAAGLLVTFAFAFEYAAAGDASALRALCGSGSLQPSVGTLAAHRRVTLLENRSLDNSHLPLVAASRHCVRLAGLSIRGR